MPNATVPAGLDLGLVVVLSIIRLRSQELNQKEIGYGCAGPIGDLGMNNRPLTVSSWLRSSWPLGWATCSPRTLRQRVLLDRAHPRRSPPPEPRRAPARGRDRRERPAH